MMAIVYDIFPLFAIACAAVGVMLFMAWLLGFQFDSALNQTLNKHLVLFFVLFTISQFYILCWLKRGQTIGMKVWKIRLLSYRQQPLNYQQCLIRFIAMLLSLTCFGLGYFWVFLHHKHQSWHDIMSNSHIVSEH